MKKIRHVICSIVAMSALLGLLVESAVAQKTLPGQIEIVTVTHTFPSVTVPCPKCTGSGHTRTSSRQQTRGYVYVGPTKGGNLYGFPCKKCGGKPGRAIGTGKVKRSITYTFSQPRGASRNANTARSTYTYSPVRSRRR